MKSWKVIIWLMVAGMAWGAPREVAEAPLPNEQAAKEALRRVVKEPWVQSDWAMKARLVTGKGAARREVTLEALGGWTPQEGRWQRVRVPGGGQWVIKGKSVPTVWQLNLEGLPLALGEAERMESMAPGIPMSWEMWAMGFLYWPEVRYVGVEKIRARWCHGLELTGGSGPWSKAQVWLDAEWGAPVEARLADREGRWVTTVRAVSMQKMDTGEWVLKRWEVVDEMTRQKVSVTVEALALGGLWPNEVRDERSKPTRWPTVPPEAWRNLE